jgi:hypothetical protein
LWITGEQPGPGAVGDRGQASAGVEPALDGSLIRCSTTELRRCLHGCRGRYGPGGHPPPGAVMRRAAAAAQEPLTQAAGSVREVCRGEEAGTKKP